MMRIQLAAVGVVLCAALAGLSSGQDMAAIDKAALVDAYISAWNDHDAMEAAGYFADNVTYYDASTASAQNGRDNARDNIIQAFLTAAPDLVWKRVGDAEVSDDSVAFEWEFSGTNTGDWSDGTKATGKSFSIRGLTLVRFQGDKIIYQGDYYDAYGFFKQLGLAQ